MPLLHPENSRGGGGGSQENRRSMADMFNFDNLFTDEAAAPATSRVNGQLAERDAWRWEPPSSPAAAQSPRSLVPAPCFPPNHSTGFASLSEIARPGAPWGGDNEPPGITDLVASFKAMGAPSTSARQNGGPSPHARRNSFHRTRLSCELLFETWQQAQEDSRALNRRASFCGVTDGGDGGGGGGGGKQLLVWTGALPPRCAAAEPAGGFSAKVFLGGLPWDINEDTLVHALRDFQPVRVEWPGAEAAPRGFAYVTLESERRVRALLAASRREGAKWIYRITSRNFRTKDVEVIPWAVADSNWVCAEGGGAWGGDAAAGAPTGSVRLEPTRTVFVGALHGILSASALATIMNDLFGGVVYAGIDTDKSKYPIGSGRVTFNNVRSYVRAVSAAFVEIRTDKFTKKIQVDPYLEDSMCSVCNLHQGPYFCRDPACYRYFCHKCWLWQHPADSPAGEGHQALMRNSKGNVNPPAVGYGNGNSNSSNGAFARLNGATPSPATSGSGGSSDCIRGELPALEWRH